MDTQHDRSAWLHGPATPCRMPPAEVSRARRLVLLGAPGIGKGTQAELLSGAYGACHLSTGDVFRTAKSCHHTTLTPAMDAALKCMQEGRLVSDDTVISLVKERLGCLRCRGGFLLDGFPRALPQAEALDQLLQENNVVLDAVINYELSFDEIAVRLTGRRSCPECKSVYHVSRQPPKVTGVCDHCGTALIQREDDRPEVIQLRLAAYQGCTRPLLEYYRLKGLLVTIAAVGTPQQILNRTLRALA